MKKKVMEKTQVEERIANLNGRLAYEEKKASKLGFASINEYFEDKIEKEMLAIEQQNKQNQKIYAPRVKKSQLQKKSSCSCC